MPKVTIQMQDVVDIPFVASDNVGNFLSSPTLLVAQDYNLFSDFLSQEGSHSCHVVTKHGISQGISWHTNIHKHMLRGLATEKSYATDCTMTRHYNEYGTTFPRRTWCLASIISTTSGGQRGKKVVISRSQRSFACIGSCEYFRLFRLIPFLECHVAKPREFCPSLTYCDCACDVTVTHVTTQQLCCVYRHFCHVSTVINIHNIVIFTFLALWISVNHVLHVII